LNNQLISLLI